MEIQPLGLLSPSKPNVLLDECLFVLESNGVVTAMRDGAIIQLYMKIQPLGLLSRPKQKAGFGERPFVLEGLVS